MIILSNSNNQEQNFYKTINKYMRMCLLNFNNDNFKFLNRACLFSDKNFKMFHKKFKKNTTHNIKCIDFEILYKPNNAYYFAHVTCIVTMYNSQRGYYSYKVFKRNTSNNSSKLEFIEGI